MTESEPSLQPQIADILVQCPIDAHRGESPQRLGDFLQTEVGQRVLTPLIENVDELRNIGIEEEKAISMAFAGVAVRDEHGAIARTAPIEKELASAPPQPKKKLILPPQGKHF